MVTEVMQCLCCCLCSGWVHIAFIIQLVITSSAIVATAVTNFHISCRFCGNPRQYHSMAHLPSCLYISFIESLYSTWPFRQLRSVVFLFYNIIFSTFGGVSLEWIWLRV